MSSSAPLPQTADDLLGLLRSLPGPDEGAGAQWAARDPQLTKPPGALGRLEEISRWLATWQGRHPGQAERVACRIFAGNHGVAAQGVSAFPAEVTVQMVANFQRGGAAVNQLCRTFGADLAVIPLNLDQPCGDFTQGAALTEAQFAAAFAAGMTAVPADIDLLVIGEMGIGNTTPAAAIAHALFGGEAEFWTGKGTGVEGPAFANKVRVVAEGVARHAGLAPLDTLRCLGGFELAAMAGATVAARLKRIPVLLDGYVCCAAVAPLAAAQAGALDHCLVGHASAEPGHRRLLERLGKAPLLDFGMRLGEGSGAMTAVGLVKAAAACHAGMATFGEAGVSDKE